MEHELFKQNGQSKRLTFFEVITLKYAEVTIVPGGFNEFFLKGFFYRAARLPDMLAVIEFALTNVSSHLGKVM